MDTSEFQTVEQPLGPFRHEVLSENIPASSALLDDVGPFHDVFTKGSKIIIGRRGAGKTAVVMGYNALATYGSSSGDVSTQKRRNNFKTSLSDFGQMHDMLFSVAKRVHETFGALEQDFATAEHLNDFWTDEIWMVVLKCFYSEYKKGERSHEIRNKIPSLILYFEGNTKNGDLDQILQEQALLRKSAIVEILDYIKNTNGEVYLLIDSMDEFPIRNPLFRKLAKGFLKCVHDFNQKNRNISIIFCIPDELESFFEDYTSNISKDFGDSIKLNWSAGQILRIIAHRYRTFLSSDQSSTPSDFIKKIENLSFVKREDMQTFYSYVMADMIVNGIGSPETSLAYIVRHTQLLPREFIIIFNRAIKNAISQTRSSSYIVADAIVKAVEESEDILAKNILAPYKTIYPRLIEACDRILPNMKPICSMADLDKIRSQFKGIEDDVANPWSVLYEMGIIGQLVRKDGKIQSTDRYVYAKFKFNSLESVNFSNEDMFCFHPLFSKKWGIYKNRTSDMKLIYPADVGELWEDLV